MSDDIYEGGIGGGDQVDPSESLTGDNTEDPLDAGYSPPDREPRGSRFGTTADEQLAGESLDELLAEEEPDIDGSAWVDSEEEPRTGRLVAPDEGAHEDEESDEVAFDAGRAGYASSAEEAAVHVTDEEDDEGSL